jgi:hypothetical protein
MSIERRKVLAILGANLILTPGAKGMKAAIEEAERIATSNPNYFMPDQFTNENNPLAHYETTGPEIFRQSGGEVDVLVAGREQALTVPRRAVRSAQEVPALAALLGIQRPQMPEGRGSEKAERPPAGNSGATNAGGRRDPDASVVFVKTADGYAVRKVNLGLSDYDDYEVLDGVSQGEQVAVFLASRALDMSREFVERRRSSAIPGLSRGGGPR